jgi:hypothetical protein
MRRGVPSEYWHPLTLEGRSHSRAETIDLVQVDMAVQSIFQEEAGLVHADQRKGPARFDLHRDVDVAIGVIVATCHGAGNREMTYATAAEFWFLRGETAAHCVESFRRHDICPEISSAH